MSFKRTAGGMNCFNKESSIVITCPKRLTPWLSLELKALGVEKFESFLTGVRLYADMNHCIGLNLRLRCASQILYQLDQFQAADPNHLYDAVLKIPWELLLPDPGYFSVTSNVNHPTIDNNMFANLRVKDAIVDRIRQKSGRRPVTGSEREGAVIHLHWNNDNATIFIDSSGDSLARHGYRKIPGQAPMLEALAAATIYASTWDKQNPFVNPMCGSGTVAIEAALMASGRYPGLFRNNYSFMHLLGYDPAIYLEQVNLLQESIVDKPIAKIIATDRSERAIENAQKNATAAGVRELINFDVCDFRETIIPSSQKGILFINPEYGQRMGELVELEKTYEEIGDFMKKKCTGYTGYVFTGNLDLAKKIGLKPKRRIEFYTSTIDCRLLEYELYQGSKMQKPEIKQNDPT